MKKLLVAFLGLGCLNYGANAQSMGTTYKTALGARIWDGAGVSLKTFVTPANALEVIGYFNSYARLVSVLEARSCFYS